MKRDKELAAEALLPKVDEGPPLWQLSKAHSNAEYALKDAEAMDNSDMKDKAVAKFKEDVASTLVLVNAKKLELKEARDKKHAGSDVCECVMCKGPVKGFNC